MLFDWFSPRPRMRGTPHRALTRPPARWFRPRLVPLEDRLAPAVALGFAVGLSGSGNDSGQAIAADAAGNVYIAGTFRGTTDADPGNGVTAFTSAGGADAFVAKYTPDGIFVWARAAGGAGDDLGYGVAVDGDGNVVVTGTFRGTADFDPGPGADLRTSAGDADVFAWKLDADGNRVWARTLGGTGRDYGYGMTIDPAGNAYLTGAFAGAVDFDPGPADLVLTAAGSVDAFIWKLAPAGELVWARVLGGYAFEYGQGIALDPTGNVYTTGYFGGRIDVDPGPGEVSLPSAGSSNAFVSKLDPAGNYVWGRAVGAGGQTVGNGIAADAAGNVYVTGSFAFTADLDPGPHVHAFTAVDSLDAFLLKLDSAGSYAWAHPLSGYGYDSGYGVALDAAGNVYATGEFADAIDADPGPETITLFGEYLRKNGYALKLDSDGAYAWSHALTGGNNVGRAVTADPAGRVSLTGDYVRADFDPSPDEYLLLGYDGLGDPFVWQITQPVAPPAVLSVTPSTRFLTTATGDTFTLTVRYDAPMDPAVAPALALDSGGVLRFVSGTWADATHYVATYAVGTSEVTWYVVDVTVSGGRGVDGRVPAPNTHFYPFDIDTQRPRASTATASAAIITDATAAGGTFTLTVGFSESMDWQTAPTLTFLNGDPAGTLTYRSGEWTDGTRYAFTFDVADRDVSLPGLGVLIDGAVDWAGNRQAASTLKNVFSIHTLPPAVVAVTPSALILTTAMPGPFTLAVTYTHAMNPAVVPTLDVDSGGLLTFLSGSWATSTRYVATYAVGVRAMDLGPFGVTVRGGADLAGNPAPDVTVERVFRVDTVSPAVVSIVANRPLVGPGQPDAFRLTVTYSEPMDPAVRPVFRFEAGGVVGFQSGAWADGTHYVATYTVSAAGNVYIRGVDVTVAGGRDAVGNPAAGGAAAGVFSVDTQSPAVLGITPSHTVLTTALTGQTVTLTVAYSEPMDLASAPTVAVAAAAPLQFLSGAWADDTQYVATFTVTDQAVWGRLWATVGGGRDRVGNAPVYFSSPPIFEVDMGRPSLVRLLADTSMITDATVGAGRLTLTAEFDQPMDPTAPPTFRFPAAVGAALTFASGTWAGPTTYRATFDVADTSQHLPWVGVAIDGARDLPGNPQVPATREVLFGLDTLTPTVIQITPNLRRLTAAQAGLPFTLRVQFSEPMDHADQPAVTFSRDLAGALRLVSAGWINSVTYFVQYKIGVAPIALTAIGVRVVGGRDLAGNVPPGGTVGAVFSMEPRPPVVRSIARVDPPPTRAAAVRFRVVFSAPVRGINVADFRAVMTGGLIGAAVLRVSAVSATEFIVTVSRGRGAGGLGLRVLDDNTIRDLAGTPLGGPGIGDGNFTAAGLYRLL